MAGRGEGPLGLQRVAESHAASGLHHLTWLASVRQGLVHLDVQVGAVPDVDLEQVVDACHHLRREAHG